MSAKTNGIRPNGADRRKRAKWRDQLRKNRTARAELYSRFPRELKNANDLAEYHRTLNAISGGSL